MYYDDMLTLFVANYDQPYPVELPGFGACSIVNGVVMQAEQPTDAPWLRVSFTGGTTANATIGTSTTKLKREPFNFNVQIFVPRSDSSNETIYTYAIPATVERHLDSFLITDGLNATGEAGLIFSDQAEPKFKATIPPDEKDVWRLTTIAYQYLYQYV